MLILNFPIKESYMGTCYIQRINRNIKVCSFKRSENIQKKEGGTDRSVSNNEF